jgi:hypothetical protein
MNIFILNVMNRKNLTKTELTVNECASIGAAADSWSCWVAFAAACSSSCDKGAIERWLNEYFKQTGESLADYEVELSRDNSFREVS